MTEKRTYKSPLRADQARQTRERIVDALIEQLGDTGRTDFAMQEVAERAQVSVRTIYRHFPTREDLFDAVADVIDQRAYGERGGLPDLQAIEEVPAHLDRLFDWWEGHPQFIEASHLSALGREGRARARQRRGAALLEQLGEWAPELSEAQLRRAWAVLRATLSSQTWRTMRGELGLDAEEARDAMQWMYGLIGAEIERLRAGEEEE